MCFKVLKQFADKQTLTRKLLGFSFHPPGARPPDGYPRLSLEASARFSWIQGGRSIFGLLWSIFGLFRSLFAGNGMFCTQIIGFLCFRTFLKASRASPVCGLPCKSHTHPPGFPSSLVGPLFSEIFFYFFSPRVLTSTNCRFMIWCYS